MRARKERPVGSCFVNFDISDQVKGCQRMLSHWQPSHRYTSTSGDGSLNDAEILTYT